MAESLQHPEGHVSIEELGGDKRRVKVTPTDPGVYVLVEQCETSYSLELIAALLEAEGIAGLCDEIRRDEDPQYVERYLRPALFGYAAEEDFVGKQILDFGCGEGSSTMVLARLLPETEITGVELVDKYVEAARIRARFYGEDRLRFLTSPSPNELPARLGQFDFVVLSAVYEHLLPDERATLMQRLWAVLRPGGILFVNQTPHRWFPVEFHTTGLPLLNYLPSGIALRVARRFSPRVAESDTWNELLRGGIRGGTEREIVRILRRIGGGTPVSVKPSRMGLHDRVDLWYSYSMSGPRPMRVKRVVRAAFKVISRVYGEDFTPSLSLAIRKT